MNEQDEKQLAKNQRPDLEAFAVEQGLTDASTYQNKPAVVDAILRVRAGEEAAAVNDELKVVQDDPETPPVGPTITDADEDDDNGDDGEEAPKTGSKKAKRSNKKITGRNQGHPTEFDENGAPVYR